jgi:hypothetical protein
VHASPLHAVALVVLVAPAPAIARERALPPELPLLHTNASGTLRFRTPRDWAITNVPGEPELTEARGGGLLLRLLRREGELGLDSMHADCMLLRLAPETAIRPGVEYEYDFVGGGIGNRQALDSAFVVHYDAPIDGSADWRQRNITVVGGGESLCVVAYAPMPAFKKSKSLKRLLEAVVASVEFRPWR